MERGTYILLFSYFMFGCFEYLFYLIKSLDDNLEIKIKKEENKISYKL